MQNGKQWIHFDAQFPLRFGHDLTVRFGPVGQLLFIQFLCACKRSYPQGQISYRTEDEARVVLGAHYRFSDEDDKEWTLDEFWQWCGRRKKTRTTARGGRYYVTATRWDAWEDARNSKERERKRRSRAESVRGRPHLRGEVGGLRGEVRGVRGEGGPGEEGAVGPLTEKLLTHLEEVKNHQPDGRADIRLNGDRP